MIRSLRNSEFRKVYDHGKSRADNCLVLYILENGADVKRLGITVSKKIGNSVVRSRVKRIIKEAYRHSEPNLRTGFDYVFIARMPAKTMKSTDMEVSIRNLAQRMKVYRESGDRR